MKKTILTLSTVAVVTFGGALVGTDSVGAEPSLNKVKQDKKDVKAKLSKAESKLAATLEEMKEINSEIVRIESAIDMNEEQSKKITKAIKKLENEVETINERIEERNDILKERLAAYQANGGNVQFMEVLLGAKDPIEFLSRADAVATIANSDIELIEENEKDKEEVEKKVTEKADQKAEFDEVAKLKKEQKKDVEKKEAALASKQSSYESEVSKLSSKSADLNELEATILAEMAAPAPTNNNEASTVATAQPTEQASSSSTSGEAAAKKKAEPKKEVAYTGAGGSAISAGKSWIGRSSYSFGGTNPSAGVFDCSGFVSWAYGQEGISLPSYTGALASTGSKVDYSQAKPGDLVFFNTYKTNGHVGIYLGGGQFLGSQSSTGVAIANMNSGYWKDTFSGHVRRVK